MTEIRAAGAVAAPAAAIFDHLADLRTHWALAAGRVELADADPADPSRGGRVRMRGPLRVGREAVTEVLVAERPQLLEGRARVGRGTEARIRWELRPAGDAGTIVELSAEVVRANPLDRLLLALGARAWLARLFARVLDRLAELGPEIAADQEPPVEIAAG